MLTIQPKFTHYSNTRQIAFRGEDLSDDDKIYQEKQKKKQETYARKE